MPKISAPTVAEHRLRQRSALLEAAIGLLVAGGVNAITPTAVGAAAGLSRPAVYQYFSSGADILAAVIEAAFPPANDALLRALEPTKTPAERLDVYVQVTLRLAAEGAHRAAAALVAGPLPPECRVRLMELHREQAAPFLGALRELDVPELLITTRLLGGVLEAAIAAIESGASLPAVTERTLVFIHRAIVPAA
jgi:AcrR family transcriptional regulator